METFGSELIEKHRTRMRGKIKLTNTINILVCLKQGKPQKSQLVEFVCIMHKLNQTKSNRALNLNQLYAHIMIYFGRD